MCKQKTKKVYKFLQQKKIIIIIDVHTLNQKKQRKYIDSYNIEEKKMINVHTVNQKKNKEITQILTIWKKKMINVHAVNKKKSTQILMCTL